MEVARFRRRVRIATYVGAAVVGLGILSYFLWNELLGVMLMILGAVVVIMCLSISHLFSMYDLHHMLDQKGPDKEWKDWK